LKQFPSISCALNEIARERSKSTTNFVFVFVPVCSTSTETRAPQSRKLLQSLRRIFLPQDRQSSTQDIRERFADGVQTIHGDWPFWTWFIDNPRTASN